MRLINYLLTAFITRQAKKKVLKDKVFLGRLRDSDKKIKELSEEIEKDIEKIANMPNDYDAKIQVPDNPKLESELNDLLEKLISELNLNERQVGQIRTIIEDYGVFCLELTDWCTDAKEDTLTTATQIGAAKKGRNQNIEGILTSSQRSKFREIHHRFT